MRIREHPKYKGIFTDDKKKKLFTKNLVPGQRVYGERLIFDKKYNCEFREAIPGRSKLFAALRKNIKKMPIKEGDKVLYLGIASGTTASHVSDIIGWNGIIFGVEVAPRPVRDLIPIVKERRNIIPILEDASKPERYLHIVPIVDIIYQDIAQPHQVEIFLKNIDYYLKSSGYGFLAVKARSIDVSRNPKEIFREVEKTLENANLRIVDVVNLHPFHKDHAMFLIKNK